MLKIDDLFKKSEYYIGVDTTDKEFCYYCLVRKNGVVIEVLLSKTMRKDDDFNEEVENLSKYFQAIKLVEHNYSDSEAKIIYRRFLNQQNKMQDSEVIIEMMNNYIQQWKVD